MILTYLYIPDLLSGIRSEGFWREDRDASRRSFVQEIRRCLKLEEIDKYFFYTLQIQTLVLTH